MKKMVNTLFAIISLFLVMGCMSSADQKERSEQKSGWEEVLSQKMPLLGHRNWILIVDKAYPAPAGANILVLNSEKQMSEVLERILQLLSLQKHVRPVFYLDKEIDYLDDALALGLKEYKTSLTKLLPHIKKQSLLHEDVFGKMDKAADLFQVIVVKTESLIPYSSVFIELDCKYWDADREKILRERMLKSKE
ncbi:MULTISPECIES: RbsD/FucU domain-containing protein [Sphingobacterium]|uniref:RbsD/FucU domain-containing protein n=1 Tax=Sphingobacterium TaxID=28453 RepID=UPI00257B735D|nr:MULTISPECIES: RbsD/FucU domain-containing protein [Sphingobacterium]